jgi:PIF1-like helicase
MFERNYMTLLPSQKEFVDSVISAIERNQGYGSFVDAPGGTGKTYCLNRLLAFARGNGYETIAVASSGIASNLLSGGHTFYSTFKVPLKIDEHIIFSISAQSILAERIRNCRLVIWDEAPMSHKFLLEGLDRTLKDLCQSTDLFGGKIVVLEGDFRQVLPII